jgi:hypothetical protein
MPTLTNNMTEHLFATDVHFLGDILYISLSNGQEIVLPLNEFDWLRWLADATPAQRANWSLEPGGFAIYWEDLDDGIEVCHVLDMQPVLR